MTVRWVSHETHTSEVRFTDLTAPRTSSHRAMPSTWSKQSEDALLLSLALRLGRGKHIVFQRATVSCDVRTISDLLVPKRSLHQTISSRWSFVPPLAKGTGRALHRSPQKDSFVIRESAHPITLSHPSEASLSFASSTSHSLSISHFYRHRTRHPQLPSLTASIIGGNHCLAACAGSHDAA